MSLALRNIFFTVAVPGAGAAYAPWWILIHSGATPEPVACAAVVFIVAGAALYVAELIEKMGADILAKVERR